MCSLAEEAKEIFLEFLTKKTDMDCRFIMAFLVARIFVIISASSRSFL